MEKKNKKGSIFTKLIVGGAIGSVLSLLFATKKGRQKTKEISQKTFDKGKEITSSVAEKFLEKYNEIKNKDE